MATGDTHIMTDIVNQKKAREAKKLPFCYICGNPLQSGEVHDDDHVPPKSMFLTHDRNFPIILRVHKQCNAAWQIGDERVGFLIKILHGGDITKHSKKYKVKIARAQDGRQFPLLGNIPLKPMIGRIMRAFNAALYQEFMPQSTKNTILTPIPEAEITNGGVAIKKVPDQFRIFADLLRSNIIARTTDKIISNNGKLRYECAWPQLDNGQRFCIFALDIYNWRSLGDQISNEDYACIGAYFLNGHMPDGATPATKIKVDFPSIRGLNPFA